MQYARIETVCVLKKRTSNATKWGLVGANKLNIKLYLSSNVFGFNRIFENKSSDCFTLFQKLSLKQLCQTVKKERCQVEKIEIDNSNEIPVTKQNEHVFAQFGIMDSRALQI